MNLISVIGVLASVFTAIALVPQLSKLIKEKRPENISLGMLASLMIGVGLWVYYGFLKEDWIIIVSNSFSWLINMTIILLTIKYKNRPPYIKRY
jgi:MtN3 and saliva related transmembrane protein